MDPHIVQAQPDSLHGVALADTKGKGTRAVDRQTRA